MLKKTLSVTFVLLLAVSAVSWAQISKEAGETGSFVPSLPEGTVVLYDQTDSASGNGAPDQNFEPAFDAYDSEGADDFEITWPNGWDVEFIDIVGTQSAGGAPTAVSVNIYPDDAGSPGAVAQCSYPSTTSFTGNTSIQVDLVAAGGACTLPPGTWWVAFQVDQTFGGGGGQHFWSNRSATSGNQGVWRNPLDGFGTGCTDWMPQAGCGVGGASDDWLFAISGIGRTEPVPTIPVAGLALMLAALLLVSLIAMRRFA